MTTILAAHVLNNSGDGVPHTIMNSTKWIKLVDGFNVANIPHGTKIVGRVVFKNEFQPAELNGSDTPEAYAERVYYEQLRPHILANPTIKFWETGNEQNIGEFKNIGLLSLTYARLLNRYTLRISQLIAADGKKPVGFNFATGNPDLPEHDRFLIWRELIPALKFIQSVGGYLGLHEYSNLISSWDTWLQYRYRHVIKFLEQERIDLRILLTEFGFDNLPDGGRPWRIKFGSPEEFVNNLANYVAEVQKDYPKVEAVFYFTFGGGDDWKDHNADGINFPRLWFERGPKLSENNQEEEPEQTAFQLKLPNKIIGNGPVTVYGRVGNNFVKRTVIKANFDIDLYEKVGGFIRVSPSLWIKKPEVYI